MKKKEIAEIYANAKLALQGKIPQGAALENIIVLIDPWVVSSCKTSKPRESCRQSNL